MSERVLVIGGSGRIGRAVVRQLCESDYSVDFTYYQTKSRIDGLAGYPLDIRDRARTLNTVEKHNPDVVVHAAAATDVDRCEKNAEYAQGVNIAGSRNVVAGCEQIDAHLVALSTAYVFGAEVGPYEISDARCPVNTYGESKAASERLVLSGDLRSTVIRTDQPYGWQSDTPGDDFVEWILDGLTQKDTIEVYNDWYGAPTHVDDISEAVERTIADRHLGVFHCVGPTYLSRYAWAKQIATAFGYESSSVRPIPSKRGEHPANRPDAELATYRSNRRLRINPISSADGLSVVRDKIKTENELGDDGEFY